MILRARVVLPVRCPPIVDGALVLSRGRIQAVGPWRDLRVGRSRGQVLDLGETVLLPGLVNAHAHLDYTGMAGQIEPGLAFVPWARRLMTLRSGWSKQDSIRSWLDGAAQLVRTGTTTVANIESHPGVTLELRGRTPLRVWSFLEITGVRSGLSADRLLRESLACIPRKGKTGEKIGLSPHALYSTVPELVCLAAAHCRRKHGRWTMHVAESSAEMEMFQHGSGPMADWLRPYRDLSDCGQGTPVRQLDRLGVLGNNLLAVHVNLLGHGDAARLARHDVSVVHCPRSHGFFGHPPFPRPRLAHAGVNICLGTDSLASVEPEGARPAVLDMFAEMRQWRRNEPRLPLRRLLEMATVNGARALGLENDLGDLAPGLKADIIALPCAGAGNDVLETVLHHAGPVRASMIGGVWAVRPG